MEQPSNWILLGIGGGVVALAVFLIKRYFTKLLDDQFDRIKAETKANQEEREYDNFMLLWGNQVMGDCLHELIYCVVNGTHNGGLERASENLEKYRQESNRTMTQKAAKYNIKIER